MNDFLPKGYVTPESERRFMELAEGQNTFRVSLASDSGL